MKRQSRLGHAIINLGECQKSGEKLPNESGGRVLLLAGLRGSIKMEIFWPTVPFQWCGRAALLSPLSILILQ